MQTFVSGKTFNWTNLSNPYIYFLKITLLLFLWEFRIMLFSHIHLPLLTSLTQILLNLPTHPIPWLHFFTHCLCSSSYNKSKTSSLVCVDQLVLGTMPALERSQYTRYHSIGKTIDSPSPSSYQMSIISQLCKTTELLSSIP